MNSSVSNFSFWFGTTLGILKRNFGLETTSVCCCWWWLWWWEVWGGWNMSVWCEGGAGPGCWGGWLKGNMLKEEGAALCSILRPGITSYLVPGTVHHTYWLSGCENHKILSLKVDIMVWGLLWVCGVCGDCGLTTSLWHCGLREADTTSATTVPSPAQALILALRSGPARPLLQGDLQGTLGEERLD